MTATILILGGYGNTGRLLARLLLAETDARVVLAGRSKERAESTAAMLNADFGERASAIFADAADMASLVAAMRNTDLVVVASSTSQYTKNIARAALNSRTDYFDIQYAPHKLDVLRGLADQIRESGRCFITDGGFHPGLPAVLVCYAATRFEQLHVANVGSVIKLDWAALDFGRDTIAELLDEMANFVPEIWRGGQWERVSAWTTRSLDFGYGFGRQPCIPMMLEEMRLLPDQFPDLQETGFFVGGFNWFTDWIVSPLAWLASKLWWRPARLPLALLMGWSLRRFSRPPFGTLLKAEAEGIADGASQHIDLTLFHEDGYVFTAVPVAAAILQYLDGSARRPGVWLQAHCVEPTRMMNDMQRMGIEMSLVEGLRPIGTS